MSDPLFDEDDDANTPLTAEEREGLIPTYIALCDELTAKSILMHVFTFNAPRRPAV